MMRIHTSDQLAVLADKLAEGIYREGPANPVLPVTVIVPNRETARWLSLHISEKEGVAANLKWLLPSEWMWENIRLLHPGLPALLPSDIGPMRWTLYELLGQDTVTMRFPKLNQYLRKGGRRSETRRWSLAGELASMYDQYQVYRPRMILRWEGGTAGTADPEEKWQMELWKILSDRWKSMAGNEKEPNRPELYLELLRHMEQGRQALAGEGVLHIFNPGLLSRPMLELFSKHQERQKTVLYLIRSTVPGEASPEVVRPGSEAGIRLGGEQAEMIELVRELFPGAEFHASGAEESPRGQESDGSEVSAGRNEEGHAESFLKRIQRSIRENRPFPASAHRDGSVDIRSCHSPLRETEVLYDRLQELFSEESVLPGLTPDEVLVVTPAPELYAPYIDAVFGTREEGRISLPCHLSDPSRVKGALAPFLHLLRLPLSRFTLSEVLEFIRHQPVAEKFRFSEADLRTLEEWLQENRVWWGLSGEHRETFGQPPDETRTWRSALRRGWLGQIAGGEPGDFMKETLLFPGVRSGEEQQLWARFSQLMRHLHKVTREAAADRTGREWAVVLRSWTERLLPVQGVHDPVRTLIDRLERETEAAGTVLPVAFPMIRQTIQSMAEEVSSGSAFFTRGILFSAMVPVRSIPFRVIALLGLNDDRFPRKPVKPDFDLMTRNPQKGERERKKEDRNLFLESVMAAGELHYCSYVGRSQMDDEPIPPSPVLAAWAEQINRSLAAGSGDNRNGIREQDAAGSHHEIVIQERLNGFSEAYFREEDPDQDGSGRPGRGSSPAWYELAVALQKKRGARGLSVKKPLSSVDNDDNLLQVSDIENFFTFPVRSFFRQRIGIRSLSGSSEEHEFTTTILERHLLFERMFGWQMEGMSREKMQRLVSASGILPAGYPGEQLLGEITDAVSLAYEELTRRFGPARRKEWLVDIGLDGIRVRGELLTLSVEERVRVIPSKPSGKYLLPLWASHLLLSIARGPAESWCLFGVRDAKPEWRMFRPVRDPDRLFRALLKVYKEGMDRPLPLFPKTSFTYYQSLSENQDPDRALKSAVNEWEGGAYKNSRGEREDEYYTLLYGEAAELNGELLDQFLHESGPLLQPLVEHLEVPE